MIRKCLRKYSKIALDILHTREKEILPAFISKHNSTQEKNISINDSKWRKRRMTLSAVEKLSTLLRGITSW